MAAKVTLAIFIGLDIVAELELVHIGLVGDDADGAGQRSRAIKRALRPGQRFYALQIIGMDVGHFRARDWNVVQIIADRGIGAARWHDAAEKGGVAAWPDPLERYGWQQRGEIAQALDLPLRQRFSTQRLHGNRHFLDALRTAGRRDDDFSEATARFIGR